MHLNCSGLVLVFSREFSHRWCCLGLENLCMGLEPSSGQKCNSTSSRAAPSLALPSLAFVALGDEAKGLGCSVLGWFCVRSWCVSVAAVRGWFGVAGAAVVSLHASLVCLAWDGRGWSLPAVGLLLAVVLGLSLGQHLAQLKLVQDAEVCAVLTAVPFTSHGKGKGFSLLPCSAGAPWGGIGLWMEMLC